MFACDNDTRHHCAHRFGSFCLATQTDAPIANSRVERRHRSIKEIFRACMIMATGGLPYYYALWGPGIVYAMKMNNINDDSTGRTYIRGRKDNITFR